MKIAEYYSNGDIRIDDAPRPSVGANELLLDMRACGLCGSDVVEWYRVPKAPVILGHEIAGVVAEVGANVDTFKPGDRVAVTHHVPCNTCRTCLRGNHTACSTLHSTNVDPGGLAEFVRIPAINVDRGVLQLPDTVSWDQAVFTEPLGCVVRAQRIADVRPGDRVLILGAGTSGLLHAGMARLNGATRIVIADISPYRLRFAAPLGVDSVVDASQDLIAAAPDGDTELYDHVVVCTASPIAAEQAMRLVDKGGAVTFFAASGGADDTISVPSHDFWRDSKRLLWSYAASPQDLNIALAILAAQRIPVDGMVTHRLPLEQAAEAFALVASGTACVKVIVTSSDQPQDRQRTDGA